MSYISNLPPGALYDDNAPWSTADAAGSSVDSEPMEFDYPPRPYVQSAANITWIARLAAAVKEIR